MSTDLDTLTTQAMALSPEQRVELAHRLWESVGAQVDEDDELLAEIERRDAEMEAGTMPTYSHEEVMRAVRKALGE